MNGQPDKSWSKADSVGLLVWGAAIICLSVLWNQFIFQPGLPDETLLVALLVFALGVPLVFGAIAGCLIHRDGPWREVFLLAAVGAACIALSLYSQWVNDPRACTPSPHAPCDISLGISMTLSFAVCYVPFLVGVAAGRAAIGAARAVAGRGRSSR